MQLPARLFLLLTATLLVGALYGYVRFVNAHAFERRELPVVYAQFLLESATQTGGKVIIESGSNSKHAIVPDILADYFEAPVITVAQNAGYPLLPKLYNLLHHVEAGDVIVLPLEWNLYADDAVLSTDFLAAISRPESSITHYYDALPPWERGRFLLTQYPLQEAVSSIRAMTDPLEFARENLATASGFQTRLWSDGRWAWGNTESRDNNANVAPAVGRLSCNDYVFASQQRNNFRISSEFRRALSALDRLREKGAQIFFTWPAVVDSPDSPCYRDAAFMATVQAYAGDIRAMLQAAGYPMLGEYRDSHFPARCFVDTYYHITSACARERTQALLANLRAAGAEPIRARTGPRAFLRAAERRLDAMRPALLAPLEPTLPAVSRVTAQTLETDVLLSGGWAMPEERGTWSLGWRSTLVLRLPPELASAERLRLRIRGDYFNGVEKTGVQIGNTDRGRHVLQNKVLWISQAQLDGDLLRLQLTHEDVRSPYELGRSDDQRKLKFMLRELVVKPAPKRGQGRKRRKREVNVGET